MTQPPHSFDEAEYAKELERRLAWEGILDAATQRCLTATGLAPGWRCVAVGATPATVANWMSHAVAPSGNVVAVDTHARFLSPLPAPNLDVRAPDLREAGLDPESVDLVHARFALVHVREWSDALAAIVAALKPGAWLVLEEPDFSGARTLAGPTELRRAFNNVHNAIEMLFAARGLDHAFGARLPGLLQEHRLETISLENDAPIVPGGSPQARMMATSAMLLAKACMATGFARPEDILRYGSFANDASCWATYHATIRAIARKPLVAAAGVVL